jgi:uncharacterized phage infection (PIP) family protein YhgE
MLQTIKFRTSDAPKDITEQDTAVASIKTLMATMTKQVENLENKITELNSTAKSLLDFGMYLLKLHQSIQSLFQIMLRKLLRAHSRERRNAVLVLLRIKCNS